VASPVYLVKEHIERILNEREKCVKRVKDLELLQKKQKKSNCTDITAFN